MHLYIVEMALDNWTLVCLTKLFWLLFFVSMGRLKCMRAAVAQGVAAEAVAEAEV